jgi:dynein intermediate chain
LEDLKKRRELRGEDTAKVKASAAANLDEYIDGLLSEPSVAPAATSTEEKKVPDIASSSVSGDTTAAKDASSATETPSAEQSMNVVAEPAPAPPPKTVETFTVATQTEDFEEFMEDSEEQQSQADAEDTEKNDVETIPIETEKPPKILSSEEVFKEVASEPFSSFINTASKKVERMLGTPILGDLLVDYVGEKDNDKAAAKDASDKFLDSWQLYEAPKWTSSRDVTDLDWSPLHRELLLSTYQMPSLSSSIKGSAAVSAVAPRDTLSSSLTPRSGELQSDGLAVVWNLSMQNRPEHIFTCGSPVTSGRFHATDSTLVIGGCQSGQLVVWDVRSGRLPVQKSALTTVIGGNAKGHTHPIQVMEITEGGVSCIMLIFVTHHGCKILQSPLITCRRDS